MVIKKLLPITGFLVLAFFAFTKNSLAAEASISVVPQSGSYSNGQVFTASIKIDGGGVPFNASKANVSVSQNLSVQSLTLGDCGFAFVETPSTSSLSYAGVILGDSSSSCTVYTMSLKVNGSGNGFVFISEGSIKAYKGAQEILEKVNNSSYTFGSSTSTANSVQATPTSAPLTSSGGFKLYTVVYGIAASESDTSDMKVILDPGQPNQMMMSVEALSDNPSVLAATFENVPEGVHEVEVLKNDASISKQIVNVEGPSREINLGVTPKPKTPIIWYLTAAIVIILILTIGIAGYILYWKKTHQVSE